VDADTVAEPSARRFAAALLQAALRDHLADTAAAATATVTQPPRHASQKASTGPAARRFETALTAANAHQQAETARSAAASALTQSPGPASQKASTNSAARRFQTALTAANARRETDEPGGEPEHAAPEEVYSGASPAVRRFNSALRSARSPGRARSAGPVRVTVSSDWTGTICRACKHTIRVGDLVREHVVDDTAVAIHDMPDLPCHSGAQPLEAPPAESVFAVALRAAVQRVRPFKVNRLRPGHPLLNGDYGARKSCPGCGHTFRPFERIARCPCSPAEPTCSMPAHRDPAMHQFCFDFLADPQNEHCQMDWHKRERKRA
jgi:hypothetical protein